MADFMITTTDNPFDPYTQFDEWYAFDTQHGYNTSSYIARVAYNSDELSEADQDLAWTQAMDEIIEFNVTGNYKRVYASENTQENTQENK